MADRLSYIPVSVVAGESIWIAAANTIQSSSDIVLTNYTPAGGYTLAYRFAAPTPITVSASANGADTGWTLDVTAAQTLLWTAGHLRYAGVVTHTASSRVFAVDEGSIVVSASPLHVSQYQAALTAIEAAILTFATNPQRSFSVDGLSVSYNSVQELIDLRDFYRAQVLRETGRSHFGRILTRFT